MNDSNNNNKLYFVYDFSNGFGIRRGFNVWLYLAYSCLLISYAFKNILYIRIIIMLASFFFVLWGLLTEGLRIQLETIIFNMFFVIINLYQIIRLLIKKIPPKFSNLEEYTYNITFKNVFSKDEYKMLLEKSNKEYLSTNQSQICRIGQSFKDIIYVAKLNNGFKIELRDVNNQIITYVEEGSWIGIGEYAIREDYLKNQDISSSIINGKYELVWGVSATIVKNKDNEIEHRTNQYYDDDKYIKQLMANKNITFLKKRSEGCIIYRFSLVDLEKLYNDKDILFVFKNGLQSLWLSYTTNYIVSQNKTLLKYFDMMSKNKNNTK